MKLDLNTQLNANFIEKHAKYKIELNKYKQQYKKYKKQKKNLTKIIDYILNIINIINIIYIQKMKIYF